MIWKAIKSFFTLPDESKNKINRKMKHSTRPGIPDTAETKLQKGQIHINYENEISNIFDEISQAADQNGAADAVAFVKSRQITGTPLTANEIKYIAVNCDFSLQNGEPDPRLVEVINFAVNLHAIKTQDKVNEILNKFDTK